MNERGLRIRGLEARYGASQVLFGIDIDIQPSEFVTLIGRNGRGKSTTVNSIMGILQPHSGNIHFEDQDITRRPAFVAARVGLGLVPEGRRVFSNLSVRENLVATAVNRSNGSLRWDIDAIYTLFPRLKERSRNLGVHLSGGEQQMLTIGRALMTNPKMLILDEATEGLAPVIRSEIWQCLQKLKAVGIGLLVVDKNIGPLLKLADRHYIMEKGRIIWSGPSQELRSRPELLSNHVGLERFKPS